MSEVSCNWLRSARVVATRRIDHAAIDPNYSLTPGRPQSDRRTFYNETVQLNNIAIERFPGSVFAKCFGFSAADSFHFAHAGNATGSRNV
jgi:LemA family